MDSRGGTLRRTIIGYKDAYDKTLAGKKLCLETEATQGHILRGKLASKFKTISLKSPVKFTSLNGPTM